VTDDCCPLVVELEGLNTSSDDVTADDRVTTTRSYTALIPVDQLITNTTLVATYDGGASRSSSKINIIGKKCIR